ncbi:MAG TPA: formate dehydrogenase, partial [Solirubrobacteraceae bacterium]
MPGPRLPPLLRQLATDPLGLSRSAQSKHSERLRPRIETADRMVRSVCPYCAVGCGQRVYAKDDRVIHIEGDPDSPISRGRLCPKGSASEQLVNSPMREYKVKYRRPGATDWEELSLDRANEMIAERLIKTREET